jgi:4-coumarate--CoA ligase
MTEIGSITTIQSHHCKYVESIGFLVPNMELKVIDLVSKEPLGPNKNGELCIKAPASMMDGYYKNVAATREIIDEEG